MVPLIETSDLAVSTALRIRIAESCRRDLSKAFVVWLREDFNQPADLLSIAAQSAKREGAGQDFQTVAILGFAADARVLSERELSALKKGVKRLAGRSPVVNGVPMPFCADAVGILGVALGTAIIANAEITGQVIGWAMRFLKSAYERDRADDWQRCLLAAADLKIGTRLNLSIPNSVAVADVRLALLSKGVIDCPDSQVRQDAARVAEIAIHEPFGEIECERAALRVAALEWITTAAVTAAFEKEGFISEPEIWAYAKVPKMVMSPVATQHENGRGIEITDRRPINLSDRLHRFHQLAGVSGVAVCESVGADQSQPAASAQIPRVKEAQQPNNKHKVKKPVRRNQKYRVIDKALREIGDSRPRTQEEVFQSLEGRDVAIPPAEPFMTARGWMAGFRRDTVAARSWLSKRWGELDLAPLPRGPKNRKK